MIFAIEGITGGIRKDLIPPCKDCQNKKPGCHDSCDGYHAWRENIRKAQEYMDSDPGRQETTYRDRWKMR